MSSNTFGKEFCLTTWGESHGAAVGCVVDGCPSGLKISQEYVQEELNWRRPGQSDISTSRGEKDKVELLSGVFDGKTVGAPISMLVWNEDKDSSAYKPFKDKPRPGHADLTWREKFGFVDWRGGGRSSARETVGRVAGGAVAKKLLEDTLSIEVFAYTKEIAGVVARDMKIENLDKCKCREITKLNPIRALDLERAKLMEQEILNARADKDSVGGVVEVVALNVPSGFGEPVFDKLNADLAKAVMSIPAAKGVEFGLGFQFARMKGSESNDDFVLEKGKVRTKTNKAGGILGGISNGMPMVLRVAFRAPSSIAKEQQTVDLKKKKAAKITVEGRHDPCIVPRAVPIVEAMVALVLADHGLRSGLVPRKL
ncbi:MAG: chorismate synthase [Candidatus Altiarchaeota archaeon]|nr:chorismate synthase [Candidatus Altiarchaeota archaeon]